MTTRRRHLSWHAALADKSVRETQPGSGVGWVDNERLFDAVLNPFTAANLRVGLSPLTASHYDVVVRVPSLRAGRHLAWSSPVDTDIPVIRKQFNDVVVTEVVGGVEAMRLCPFRVDVGVVHDEKDAMRGDRRDKCLLGLARVRVTQGWIESGDQIEAARGNRGIFESGLHPLHVDGGLPGSMRRVLECHS
jgi:hypothetical protein